MGHFTLSLTTMLSYSVLVAVIFFSLTAHHTEGLSSEETTTEKDVQDGKCPHLPCPLPGNCTHKVWSHFWYHGKLCKGCQYCVNVTSRKMGPDEGVQDVKCPHLPCPFPGNCTHKVWSHFWYHGKLCKGCQYCVNVTGTASDDAATDVQHQCPMFKCPAPGPCDTPYSIHEVTIPGVPHRCPGCPYCPSESSKVRRLLASCPDVSCVEPGPCSLPLKTQTLRVDGRNCPGCAYCPQ
ncbi:uncharacterized protein LOC124264897 isoform X2 [Haliotis rubra]|uniref:uncharacterized protein LOC124264897 isoform X2 n=1 Tax=Haliotis rubra TaxID=36100 RepID=UPI001EE5CBBA|nr:uncharacterized protein LOC124264897 isoform X2 [Haliotis rubra]